MSVPVSVVAVWLMIGVAGCDKKSGEAVVLSKEHIDAAPPTEETPSPDSEPTPDVQIRPMADDEIEVDSYVMKREVRGTSRDPRAFKEERWRVNGRVVHDGRTLTVHDERAPSDKYKPG